MDLVSARPSQTLEAPGPGPTPAGGGAEDSRPARWLLYYYNYYYGVELTLGFVGEAPRAGLHLLERQFHPPSSASSFIRLNHWRCTNSLPFIECLRSFASFLPGDLMVPTLTYSLEKEKKNSLPPRSAL